MQCQAHSSRTGEQCKKHASKGRTVCFKHGGKTPRGGASPHTKHGRYSKDLPTRLADRYQAAREDPALLELRDEIGLIDARLSDVLGRVDTGESGRLWRQLGHAWAKVQACRTDPAAFAAALNTLGDLITAGEADSAAWADVRTLMQERRALVESERKRLVQMQHVITADQAALLMAALTDVIRKHVTDHDTIVAITAEFERIALQDNAGEPPPLGGRRAAP